MLFYNVKVTVTFPPTPTPPLAGKLTFPPIFTEPPPLPIGKLTLTPTLTPGTGFSTGLAFPPVLTPPLDPTFAVPVTDVPQFPAKAGVVTMAVAPTWGPPSPELSLPPSPFPGFPVVVVGGSVPVSYTHLRAHET